MRRRTVVAAAVALGLLLLSPDALWAHDCSSLHDCWNTIVASAAAAVAAAAVAVAAAAVGAPVTKVSDVSRRVYEEVRQRMSYEEVMRRMSEEVFQEYRDWANRQLEKVLPSESAYREALERSKEAAESVQDELNVFGEIGENVGDALETGRIDAPGDRGLGETRDNFTPQGDLPFDIDLGPVGGVGIEPRGAGRSGGDRDGGGTGAPPPPSRDRPVPLGEPDSAEASHESTDEQPPDGPAEGGEPTEYPTYEDLGIDPADGDWFRYLPSEGVVEIYHGNGTVETRPWPPPSE